MSPSSVAARERAADDEGQALPGVLVEHGQHFERPAVLGGVEDEVISPHVVRALRGQTHGRVLARGPRRPTALPRPLRYLELGLAPEPVDPLPVDGSPPATQHGPRPAVPIAGVVAGEADQAGHERAVPRRALPSLTVRGTGLPDGAAGPALAHAELALDVGDGS